VLGVLGVTNVFGVKIFGYPLTSLPKNTGASKKADSNEIESAFS
jgi:hypothetical protein